MVNIILWIILAYATQDAVPKWMAQEVCTITGSANCFSTQLSATLYILDQRGNRLKTVLPTCNIQKSIGGSGWGNYEFDNPTDVSSSFLLDIYVTDFNNRRIQRFDKNLNYVQTYDEQTLPASIGRFQPRACAISTQGDLFVLEIDGKRILKIDKRNQLVKEFGTFKDGAGMLTEPKDIAVSQSDEVFVLDQSKIVAFDIFGNYTRTILLPDAEWKNIQASEKMLIATSSDQIYIRSLQSDKLTILTHTSIIGLPSNEQFVDAVLYAETLIVLTSTSLYYCSVTP